MTSSRPSQPFPLPAHPLRIATAQAPVVRGAVEANAAQAAALIERAAADGCGWCCSPRSSSPGTSPS